MVKGNATNTIVHFKGNTEDFIVFVDDAESVTKWKSDKSIPLAQVVNGWKIFVTHKHGNQGVYDGASNAQLDNEFGTHKDDEAVAQILEKGTIQTHENDGRRGDTNDSKGGRVAH